MCVAESKANEELIREVMRVGTSLQLSKPQRKRERKKKRDIFHCSGLVGGVGIPCSGLGSQTPTVVVSKET